MASVQTKFNYAWVCPHNPRILTSLRLPSLANPG